MLHIPRVRNDQLENFTRIFPIIIAHFSIVYMNISNIKHLVIYSLAILF